MYLDCHENKTRSRNEFQDVLQFAELRYDAEEDIFTSVNRCMPGVSFGEIRKLKDRIHQVRGARSLEDFCNIKSVREKTDMVYLYVIYKTLAVYPWKEKSNKMVVSYSTMFGDKRQSYYEVYKNFRIADEAEAERWMVLFEYLAKYEEMIKTQIDSQGKRLSQPKFYNVGIFSAVLNYTMEMGYTSASTKVDYDFEIVDKILAFEGAEEIFLKYKREEIEPDEVRLALGMDEKFERDVLKIVSPVQSIIEFALRNGYAQSKADIDISLIENVIFPGNGEIIKKFAEGEIKDSKLRREIGFEVEFAEAYFDTSKLNIKKVEARLQEIKRKRSKEMVRESKLLIKLYSYVVKNGIGCGSNMKPVPRNKHLKPEMLEQLIM